MARGLWRQVGNVHKCTHNTQPLYGHWCSPCQTHQREERTEKVNHVVSAGLWPRPGAAGHPHSLPRHHPQWLQLWLVCSRHPQHEVWNEVRCERPLQEHLQLDHFLSHNGSLSVLPTIRASDEELTWFGKNNSLTGLTLWQTSITASVISLSMVPGSLLGGYYGGRVGPKRSVMVASVLAAICNFNIKTYQPYLLSTDIIYCSAIIITFVHMKGKVSRPK